MLLFSRIFILFVSLLIATICNTLESTSRDIFQLATQFLADEKFTDALVKFEQALKLFEHEKDSKAKADTLYLMGICYNSLAQYKEASQALTEAEKIHSKLGNKAELGFDVTEKANTELLQTNLKESLTLSERALLIHQDTGNRKGEADTLRNIGLVYASTGDSPKAMEYAVQSLSIAEEIRDQEGIAWSLKDVGMMHFRQGELENALKSFEKSWKVAEENDLKKVKSRILNGFALVYGDQGDRKRELEYYKRSATIAEEVGDRYQQCIIFLNSGATYYDLSEFRKSYDFISKGTALAEEIGNQRLLSGGWMGLAMVLVESGNTDTAMEYLTKAIHLAEKVGDEYTLTYALNEMGSWLVEAGDYSAALKYYKRGLEIRKKANDKNGIAHGLIYLAQTYWKQGDLDLALQNYKNSLSISEPLGMLEAVSHGYSEMAAIQYQRKDMADAEKSVAKAIEISKKTGDRATLMTALHTRGLILRDSEKVIEALASFKASVDVIESIRADFELPDEKAGYLENRMGVYEDLISLILKEKNIPEAFEYAQRSKARAFLDTLAEMRIDTSRTLSPDLRERKDHVINQLVEIQTQIREQTENKTPDKQLEKKRIELEGQYSKLILEIRNQNPQLAEAQYPQPTGLTQTQALLDDQTVLLEYFVGRSISVLFAVTRNNIEAYDLPGEKKLSPLVTQVRDVLQKPDPAFEISEQAHSKYLKVASELYADLILPAQSILQGKQKVVIASDGPLQYLPFECLLTKNIASADFSKLPYFARDYQIQYVPSVTVFALLSKKQNLKTGVESKQLLALADPAFNRNPAEKGKALVREWVGSLGALPYTRPEVEGIARLYSPDKTSVLIGSQASESNLKKINLEQYAHLHFATHGLIDEEKPQFSALVLSAKPDEEEDGYLTVREVFDLKLNADLVVLSACKTGLGKRIRGEGVTGLSRAFLCAGTSSVLVSLWNVYDRSTADLMKAFYQNMEQKKLNKADALKQARLQMIQSSKYSHPYYWAPFVLIGSN